MKTHKVPSWAAEAAAHLPPLNRCRRVDLMPATTVIHVNDMREGDIYIGRANPRRRLKGSPFANPFVIGKDGTREEVIVKYRAWLLDQPLLLAQIPTLRGKRLACWCVPSACHGHVLAELADSGIGSHVAPESSVLTRSRVPSAPAQLEFRLET